jgi:transcriptional regulator
MPKKIDLLQGTLDLLILKTLALEPLHGLGISRRIHQITQGAFTIKAGSLFPALHRLQQEGWIEGTWGTSDQKRAAKFYQLTTAGRRQLQSERQSWEKVVLAVGRVLEA